MPSGGADIIGFIEEGKQADLLILSVPDYRHLGYRFGTNLVRQVVKRGRSILWMSVIIEPLKKEFFMFLANIDLNTILYFATIVVLVIIVFGVLSFVFKHLFHWFDAAAVALCFWFWLILSCMSY